MPIQPCLPVMQPIIQFVTPAGMPDWIAPVASAVIGAVVGALAVIFVEPLKDRHLKKSRARNAKQILYEELASCMMDIEDACADPDVYRTMLLNPPEFRALDWYSSNDFEVLMLVDRKLGLSSTERLVKRYLNMLGTRLYTVMNQAVEFQCQRGELDGALLNRLRSECRKKADENTALRDKIIAEANTKDNLPS